MIRQNSLKNSQKNTYIARFVCTYAQIFPRYIYIFLYISSLSIYAQKGGWKRKGKNYYWGGSGGFRFVHAKKNQKDVCTYK
ncbi:hypothetical protein LCGC14_0789530 [marine sediment metagenome]|uniref:Uncharacterized protein n=1 Tax=marine sediment metagenome TaxID=412755 RepID=A0A0F9PXA4_9ZZZZ